MTDNKKLFLAIGIAALLWMVMFSPWTAPMLNFWYAMTFSASILWLLNYLFGQNFKRQFVVTGIDVAIGVGSAILLWGVFWLGDFLSALLFDFARPQVMGIYSLKSGTDVVLIGTLLTLIIGPAEELFWRGYVQKSFAGRYGEWIAFGVTTGIYTLVHIWSFNFMLIMAALVCGAFWGLIYRYYKNLPALIISHALWDLAVFILFPIH